MKKVLLIIALFFAVYSIYIAKSGPRVKVNCNIVLYNNSWFNSNWWTNNNNWFNNNASKNNWFIIKSYNNNKKSTISISSKGDLWVYETGKLSDKSVIKEALLFKIAILKKGASKSEMLSDTPFTSIAAQHILEKCQPGDKIIVYLMDEENYSLVENEIEVVEGGC